MKRAKNTAAVKPIDSGRRLRAVEGPAASTVGPRAVPRPGAQGAPSIPALGTARIHAAREGGVVLDLAGALVDADVDASVHPTVLAGAFRRGERVLFERGAEGAPVVLGALRTQPTPGIDAADAYTVEAKRISLRAGEEVSLTTEAAAVVVRALGEVETYADRILSRAEGVHKIIGRMLRLN